MAAAAPAARIRRFSLPQSRWCTRCRSLIGAPEGSTTVRARHASSPTFCHSAWPRRGLRPTVTVR